MLELGEPCATFTLTTEVTKNSIISFPKFLIESSNQGRFGQIAAGNFNHVAGEHGKFLVFDAKWYPKDYSAVVRIRLDSPLTVDIFSRQGANKEFARRLEDYLLLMLQAFEEVVRSETIYMTFMPGQEKTSRLTIQRKFSEKFLTGNMLNLFLLSIIIGVIIILIFGVNIGPIVLVVLIFAIVLSAGKIVALTSDWRITAEHPEVVIVKCKLDRAMIGSFMQTYGDRLPSLKKNIYDFMTEKRRQATPEEISNFFWKAGIVIPPDQIIVKRINVYGIVKKAADRFRAPVPTIMITKNPKPNAAATGVSKHLATIMITIGLLIQLDENEIELVVGHEMSHLRFGDPAILFTVFSCEYLARVYLYYAVIAPIWPLYLFFIFYVIFFVGKLLEARADLEAAYILRDPKTMATSLKKIGFRRLILDERFIEGKESTLEDWFAFDPHPPIGYRIRRLESLDMNDVPKHTFLRSISDVFRGIRKAMAR
ncbi:MAG: M48 family metalloprotease [Thermoplasmata archaeon]